ncbi:hypothetical protein [Halocola ammonii]
MKTIITTVILFGLCFYLTAYSSGHFVVMTIPILILIGALATLLISIWTKGEFWQRQIKASKIAFPLSAMVFLIGYFYETLKVMI